MKNKKIWIFAGGVALILLLNQILGWSSYIENMDNLKFLERMVKDNLIYAAGIYIVVTIVGSVVLALPGITFAILAGFLFGPLLGTICCSLATTIGAILAFLIGRFFLKDSVKPAAMKNKYLKKWLFDERGKNQIFILMITRLVPLFPYNLQNFAYGVTDIGFVTYAVGSFAFMLPGTAMYTIGTAGIFYAGNRIFYIGIALVLLVIVTGLGLFFKKHYVERDVKGQDEKGHEEKH